MEYSEINKELERLKYGEYRYNNICGKLASLRERFYALKTEVAQSEAIWRKEANNVTEFEKGNLTTAILSILGKKTERIDKEKQEALNALMKYELAKTELEQVKAEIFTLTGESLKYQNCEQQYKTLYDQKYKLIMSGDSAESLEIIELQSQTSRAYANIKEIDEAIEAGKVVIKKLDEVISSLDSADTWSLLDGGSISVDGMKYTRINQAKEQISEVNCSIDKFRVELVDSEINSLIEINISNFVRHADYHDLFFTNGFVHNKINVALKNAQQVNMQSNYVIQKLEQMRIAQQDVIVTLAEQIKSAITNK